MLGLVLCGGQSQRMGSDKGLMRLDEKSWAQLAADKLAALNIPVKLSVNEQQFPLYTTIFSKDDLIVDNNLLSVKGPLAGVLSCHLAFPEEDLFIMACDMPLVQLYFLQSLNSMYQLQPASAYVFSNEEALEPLCGIYTAKGLSGILNKLMNGALVKHSMKYMLERLDVKKLYLKEEERIYFQNFNTPADIS